MIKQGNSVKITKGEKAGKMGVVIAKAPGAGKAAIWTVAIDGQGQYRVEEKDLEAVPAK
jgi:ribosomal protein L24